MKTIKLALVLSVLIYLVRVDWAISSEADTTSVESAEIVELIMEHLNDFRYDFYELSAKEKAKWVADCDNLTQIWYSIKNWDREFWVNEVLFNREDYELVFWQYLTRNIIQNTVLNKENGEYFIFLHHFPYEYTEVYSPDDKYCTLRWDFNTEEESH